MSEPLVDLFATGDDFALCNRLFVAICEAHRNNVDVAALSEEERTVYLVWGAAGVIGNGGFRYLFEQHLQGDPYFAQTAHAFEVIGCREPAEAFQRTLALFPKSRPPSDIAKRLRLYNGRIRSWPTPEDQQFFRAQKDIERCLANYARSRQRAFRHLQ